jgi:GntR family transcriptional regulator, rspAB operon transcriptional repressor
MTEATRTRAGDGSATQRTYELLRERILSGAIEPGVTVSQVTLARDLGISRTPLREALPMLQREGLVEVGTARRVRITSITIDELEQAFALRIVNEALAIYSSIPQVTPRDEALLVRSLRAMERLADPAEVDQWEHQHRVFHGELVKHAGACTKRLLCELADPTDTRRFARVCPQAPCDPSASAAEHRQIVDACLAQDPQTASHLLAAHISRPAIAVLAALAPDHAPSRIRAAHKFIGIAWPRIPDRRIGAEPPIRGR